MLNLFCKLRRIQSEKNEKWEGEKVGYMLDIFLVHWVCALNNNSQYFDVDTMEVQVELISKSMFTLVQLTLVQLTLVQLTLVQLTLV